MGERCATHDCMHGNLSYYERGGVGSWYCSVCYPLVLQGEIRSLRDHLGSALTVISSFRPLATAVRKNLASCPPDVAKAFEGIADMVADADAEAGA